ncbi:PREDICTED: sodium/potassium/calcium exchanger 1-like [Camelina sativa]|uniref:Sodium/potassium/calcium exchanger 1-like n=1 Tax=Camelina sativa TaxID=90675 RepID=A0ABM0T0W3_CAMSA|nr:PREDICTED: sodium/potassium/calcium exchanger 1-like [Camelina sativa]
MPKVKNKGVISFVGERVEDPPRDESNSVIMYETAEVEVIGGVGAVEVEVREGFGASEADVEGVGAVEVEVIKGFGASEAEFEGVGAVEVDVGEGFGLKKLSGEEEAIEPEVEHEVEHDSEDDCVVYDDDDFDDVDDGAGGEDNEMQGGEDDEMQGMEEDVNANIADDFPEAVRGIEDGSDSDSGDDIWDDDKIPDPFSSDDEDEAQDKEDGGRRDVDDP